MSANRCLICSYAVDVDAVTSPHPVEPHGSIGQGQDLLDEMLPHDESRGLQLVENVLENKSDLVTSAEESRLSKDVDADYTDPAVLVSTGNPMTSAASDEVPSITHDALSSADSDATPSTTNDMTASATGDATSSAAVSLFDLITTMTLPESPQDSLTREENSQPREICSIDNNAFRPISSDSECDSEMLLEDIDSHHASAFHPVERAQPVVSTVSSSSVEETELMPCDSCTEADIVPSCKPGQRAGLPTTSSSEEAVPSARSPDITNKSLRGSYYPIIIVDSAADGEVAEDSIVPASRSVVESPHELEEKDPALASPTQQEPEPSRTEAITTDPALVLATPLESVVTDTPQTSQPIPQLDSSSASSQPAMTDMAELECCLSSSPPVAPVIRAAGTKVMEEPTPHTALVDQLTVAETPDSFTPEEPVNLLKLAVTDYPPVQQAKLDLDSEEFDGDESSEGDEPNMAGEHLQCLLI